MGFARRLVRKSVRAATPRPLRGAMHPVRQMRYAVTPRPVRQVSRALYTVTNPLGAAENALIGAVLNPRTGRSSSRRSAGSSSRVNGLPTRQVVSGSGIRAEEAAASVDRVEALMAVQRERFQPAVRPLVRHPAMTDIEELYATNWRHRRREVSWFRRRQRKQLAAQVAEDTRLQADRLDQAAADRHRAEQAEADKWWEALKRGEPEVTTAVLRKAFADNPARVIVHWAQGHEAVLCLLLPAPSVLPDKKAHVTPTGRLSSKLWTKCEKNALYAGLLEAHLLATLRETWAVAPSLTYVRVLGVLKAGAQAPELLFDAEVERASYDWSDDLAGHDVLVDAPCGLLLKGKSGEIQSRDWSDGGPGISELLGSL